VDDDVDDDENDEERVQHRKCGPAVQDQRSASVSFRSKDGTDTLLSTLVNRSMGLSV